MKDWIFIRYVPAVESFSIQLVSETAPPGFHPTVFTLGRAELSEFVAKAQRALNGDCPHLTLAEVFEELKQT